MHILIAPNAFKNSLTAEKAATCIQEGLCLSRLTCNTESFPIGDGGDGTGSLIVGRFKGSVIRTTAHDPLGRKIETSFGIIENGHTAVIEMAEASGIRLLLRDELDPLRASTFGTGELMKQALDRGVKKIILTMGGSATIDGGTGILNALGVRFISERGKELPGFPAGLENLGGIDDSALDKRIKDCEVVVVCDVSNILTGSQGTAAVFGKQKGATPTDIEMLDHILTRFSEVTFHHTGRNIRSIKHGGTAGGAAAGVFAFLNAKLVNGIDYYLETTGFMKALERSDLVITGEGSIDEQTLEGKGPFGVAQWAKRCGVPTVAIAGKIPLVQNPRLQKYFDALIPIGNEPAELEKAMTSTAKNIVRTSKMMGDLLSIAPVRKKPF